MSRVFPCPSECLKMANIIHSLYLVPAELIFLYFLHSNYTENYTENTTVKLKAQQQEAGGRYNIVNCFSF